ncbi:hypothetical protein B5P43_13910 [Bacillus sp. SRB_336]|nr:hypothetical protein B5P43_13910 [Bacillus sp. SRB_336]
MEEALRLMRAGYLPEWKGGGSRGPGWFNVRWPDYDPRLHAALEAALSIAGPDYDYLANYGHVQNRPVSSASSEGLSTWFTYVIRGERFCTGHIEGFIQDGRLQEMFERLLEVVNDPSLEGALGTLGE